MDSIEETGLINENESLGENIRTRRLELGLGLRELARETGLSATFIGNLERGQANPTLETLRKVANALSIPLFRLLSGPTDSSPVVRHDRRRRMKMPLGHLDIEVLTPDLQHNMVVFQVRATQEDGEVVAKPLLAPTEECFVMLQGRIRIVVSGQTYELGPGDSIYFEGRNLQSVRVISEEEAVYHVSMTPPAF